MSKRHNTWPAEPSLYSLLDHASRRVASDLRRVVSAEGLPVEFWRVLEALADECGHSMSELAEKAGMQMPAMSKLVDRMTEAALIQRSADPRDRRRVILHISDFGLQKVAALGADVQQHRNRLESVFSTEQEEQLRTLLRDFIQAHRQAPE